MLLLIIYEIKNFQLHQFGTVLELDNAKIWI